MAASGIKSLIFQVLVPLCGHIHYNQLCILRVHTGTAAISRENHAPFAQTRQTSRSHRLARKCSNFAPFHKLCAKARYPSPSQYTYKPVILDGVLLFRFIEGHAGAIVARDLCAKLFSEYVKSLDYRASHLRVPGSQSTKSTSPGGEEGYHEGIPLHPQTHNYLPEKIHPGLMEPDYPGTPKHKGI